MKEPTLSPLMINEFCSFYCSLAVLQRSISGSFMQRQMAELICSSCELVAKFDDGLY